MTCGPWTQKTKIDAVSRVLYNFTVFAFRKQGIQRLSEDVSIKPIIE